MKTLVKIAGYIALICSLYLFYVFFNGLIERNNIISQENTTVAKVLGYEFMKNGTDEIYVFTFEYFVDGNRYLKTTDLNTSSIEYNKGDEYIIYYDELNPNQSVINSWNETIGINYVGVILASSFLVLGLLLILVKYKYIKPLFDNAKKGYIL